MKSEILEEVWRIRDEFARKWNYDVDAMVAALQEVEPRPQSRVVDRRKEVPGYVTHPAAEHRP